MKLKELIDLLISKYRAQAIQPELDSIVESIVDLLPGHNGKYVMREWGKVQTALKVGNRQSWSWSHIIRMMNEWA